MIAFSIFGINIYRYGIAYFLSFIIVYFFIKIISQSKIFSPYTQIQNIIKQDLDTIMLAGILGVLIGGRLGYVFIYQSSHYITNPIEIFHIRQGGMSFLGGMIGVIIAILTYGYIKKLTYTSYLILFDIITSIAPLGIFLGRIGNFLNQELYGIPVSEKILSSGSDLVNIAQKINIFYIYESIDQTIRYNTNFISAFFEGIIVFIFCMGIMIYNNKTGKYKPGNISSVFMILYGLARFFIEYLRHDAQLEYIGYLSKGQYFFIIIIIYGLYLHFVSYKKD